MIMLKGWLYRITMRIAHRYHWHYAPPIYPDGDTQLWCTWCGFRQTIKRRAYTQYHEQAPTRRPASLTDTEG